MPMISVIALLTQYSMYVFVSGVFMNTQYPRLPTERLMQDHTHFWTGSSKKTRLDKTIRYITWWTSKTTEVIPNTNTGVWKHAVLNYWYFCQEQAL